MTRTVFGIEFSPLSADEIADLVTRDERPDQCRLLVTANLDHIAQLSDDPAFRSAYDGAWLATIDGMPVYIYSRLRGVDAPHRVPGADLFPAILAKLRPGVHRPCFVAADDGVAKALVDQLLASGFKGGEILSIVPEFGFDKDEGRSRELAGTIAAHRASHVFMGVGAPKSEIWAHNHAAEIGAAYVFCFGAGLDYAAGTRRRAPKLMRHLGFEWAWRVGSEPRRLFARYFVRSWRFASAVREDLVQARGRFSVGPKG